MSGWITTHVVAWCAAESCGWGARAESPSATDERRVIRQTRAHERVHPGCTAIERGQIHGADRPSSPFTSTQESRNGD